MKVLLIAQRFHTNLYYRVIALQNSGCKVKVIVMYKGTSEYYKDIDIQQIDLSAFTKLILSIIGLFKKNNLKSSLEMRLQSPNKELKNIFKTYNPDVVILKAYQNILAIKSLILAKRYKAKVLMLTQTTLTHIKGSKLLFKLNIKLFRYLNLHSFITPIKENYNVFKAFGIDNVYYLPFVFPVKHDKIINKQSDNNSVKIISIGKYIKRKDHLLLIKASEKLINQQYNIELNIYGEKTDNKYYNLLDLYIKQHGLDKNIKLNTNVDYTNILEKYSNNDIFVLASYAEPAAYTPVEALCNGLPVISSSQNGTKCYIKEGKNGYIFEAKNLDDLIDKMKLAINNHISLSKNALVMAKRHHSLEGFAENIKHISNN